MTPGSASTSSHTISPNHPLRQLFRRLIQQKLGLALVPTDDRLVGYLTDLLTDFTHMDRIYRVRDARGQPLRQVAEMLLEGDVRLRARSFAREREVHRHIGDFTLFWTGVFPEALPPMRLPWKPDHLIDYVAQGKQSYYIASTFTHQPYAQEAQVLRQLSELFEFCVYGLHLVRQEWQRMGDPAYESVSEQLNP